MKTLEELQKRLAALEAVEEPTQEQADELTKVQGEIADRKVQDMISKSIDSTLKEIAKDNKPEKKELAVTDIEVGDDLVPHWMKRTGAYLNAAVAHGQDRIGDMNRHKSEYAKLNEQANDRLFKAENIEAQKVIKESNLNRIQQIRALSTLTGAAGEFLLPKPFLAEIFVIIEERGIARNTFRGVPMGSKDLDLKDVASKPTVSWGAELAQISETNMTFGEGQLTTNKLSALLPWSNELQEDEVFGVVALAQELLGESILGAEDTAGFVGDGTAGTGGFTGLFNLSGATEVTMAAGSTAFSDATADDFRSLRDANTLARRRNAAYFMHPDIVSNLEGLKDSQGQFIYRQPGEGRPATLWGFPIIQTEVAPSTADSAISTRFVAFGDPSWFLFGTRRGITLMTSMEGTIADGSGAVTFSAVQNDGAILRLTERVAFKAAIEGAFSVLKTAAA